MYPDSKSDLGLQGKEWGPPSFVFLGSLPNDTQNLPCQLSLGCCVSAVPQVRRAHFCSHRAPRRRGSRLNTRESEGMVQEVSFDCPAATHSALPMHWDCPSVCLTLAQLLIPITGKRGPAPPDLPQWQKIILSCIFLSVANICLVPFKNHTAILGTEDIHRSTAARCC